MQSSIKQHKKAWTNKPGGNGGGATPVPIPNTQVKSSSADGTGVETPWESKSLPGLTKICSSVAQRWSTRLLTEGLLVRIQPEEPFLFFAKVHKMKEYTQFV